MPTVKTAKQVDGAGFVGNLATNDASTAKEVVAAVSGKSHYITHLTVTAAAAIEVTIQDNTGTPVPILGPIEFTATGGHTVPLPYLVPIQVASGQSIDVKASAAGQICVVAQGYTK